jgi:hypothetical protein
MREIKFRAWDKDIKSMFYQNEKGDFYRKPEPKNGYMYELGDALRSNAIHWPQRQERFAYIRGGYFKI